MEVRSRLSAQRRNWMTLLGLCLLACTPSELPRTEIVVVVDTDLTLGEELDELRIEAIGPNDKEQSASVSLGAGAKLPQTLGLVHEAGALGPIRVVAVGLLGDEEVMRREAELSFIADKTLSLPMHLVQSCLTRTCREGETCSEHGCVATDVDATRLAEWHGSPPTLTEPDPPPDEEPGEELDAGDEPDAGELDAETVEVADATMSEIDAGSGTDSAVSEAGTTDAGSDASNTEAGPMCMPKVEQCNQLDDDCDGVVDNGYDLTTDTRHCGMCNKVCSPPAGICCRGSCTKNCAR